MSQDSRHCKAAEQSGQRGVHLRSGNLFFTQRDSAPLRTGFSQRGLPTTVLGAPRPAGQPPQCLVGVGRGLTHVTEQVSSIPDLI